MDNGLFSQGYDTRERIFMEGFGLDGKEILSIDLYLNENSRL